MVNKNDKKRQGLLEIAHFVERQITVFYQIGTCNTRGRACFGQLHIVF